MDIIYINQIKVPTIIGIYPHERKNKQPIEIDIELHFENNLAAKTDHINDTIDYHEMTNTVYSHVSQSSYQLIEALAESISDLILLNSQIHQLVLRVSKPNALDHATNVGIQITRTLSNNSHN